MQARAVASLKVRKVKAEKVAEGIYRLSCGVVNSGYLNTAGTTLASQIAVCKPVAWGKRAGTCRHILTLE